MLAALSVLAISVSAPQATLVREILTVLQEQRVTTLPPGTIESPEVSDSLLVQRSLGLPSPVAGVEFTGVVLLVDLTARLDLEILGLDTGTTTLLPELSVGLYAAASDASWGPIDGYNTGFPLWNPSPPMIGQGDAYLLNDVVTFTDIGFWDAQAGSFQFQLVQQSPLFQAFISPTVRVPSLNQAGPVDVEVVRMAQTTAIYLEFYETFELSPIPVVSYCTSPANSTGATAALSAYGSPEAGSQWLSIEATGLPDQAAALLFASDSPASVPLGTAQLCVGGALRRVGGVQVATQGAATFHIDLNARAPGQDAHFQVFHRDPVLGLAASEGVRFTVQ